MLFGMGVYIDWKRKKINNYPLRLTHPHAKPGDDSNYRMGDNNNYTGGGMD
ncbi:hypothetical protein [Paenisporosarcina sp. HGH0030]|uniref:hypothetical protein n=1 Tax=Paenisporosarcina sp. HGH0030 TaxID=1078085 RepID=UPI0003A2B6F0|nr:hypothetical protein [Paenisporosarcina sp. HGH0030]